ncbi:MAG: pyridoxamine 5'-phosphate oxidase family protein [Acidimicrobiia bacterium]
MSATPKPGPVQTTEGYGLGGAPADGSALPWTDVTRWLAAARNYWVCTTRPDGRPHAMPVWGLWMDDAVWFSTDPASIKGRNLADRPEVVIHLESGDEVCVLEGRAERVRDRGALATFDDTYEAKYDVRPSSMEESAGVYSLRPTTALVWTEADFPTTATRFTF